MGREHLCACFGPNIDEVGLYGWSWSFVGEVRSLLSIKIIGKFWVGGHDHELKKQK